MLDEHVLRRPTFVEGRRIRLADRQTWSFPDRTPGDEDRELIDTLRAIGEAEDRPERLRAELALTILLLLRNYNLTPEGFREILTYPPGDPALVEMQEAVHALAIDLARRVGCPSESNPGVPVLRRIHWRLANFFRPRYRVQSERSHLRI